MASPLSFLLKLVEEREKEEGKYGCDEPFKTVIRLIEAGPSARRLERCRHLQVFEMVSLLCMQAGIPLQESRFIQDPRRESFSQAAKYE